VAGLGSHTATASGSELSFYTVVSSEAIAKVLTRSTPKLEPAAKCFQGFTVTNRCGWDSRAPKNCKSGHLFPNRRLTLRVS
jgi:hypothetical protein